MSALQLKVKKRQITGKKVKELRRQGITPAHLFGPGVDSLAIQCDTPNLINILEEAGHTKLVELKVERERNTRTVMVGEVQIDSFKGGLLHVDFYQVKLTEEIRVNVPIVFVEGQLDSGAHDQYERLLGDVPDAQLVQLADANHHLWFAYPQAVVDAVVAVQNIVNE